MSYTDDFLKALKKKEKKTDSIQVTSPFSGGSDDIAPVRQSSSSDDFTNSFFEELSRIMQENDEEDRAEAERRKQSVISDGLKTKVTADNTEAPSLLKDNADFPITDKNDLRRQAGFEHWNEQAQKGSVPAEPEFKTKKTQAAIDWVGNTLGAGLNSFNKGLAATADVLLGKPLQAFGWENNPISKASDYYDNLYEQYAAARDKNAQQLGGGAGLNFFGEVVEGTVAALPDALLALMTMGTSKTGSLATKAAYEGGNLLTKAGLTVETMMKNPQYWMSFARTYGSDYEEAKASGADDITATFSATITSLINSGVEIGTNGASGIQGLPDEIAEGGVKPIVAWVKSSLEEGGEEVVQGFVNNAVARVMYDSDREVLNAEQMAKEFALGASVGGLLGGGQTVAANVINNQMAKEARNTLSTNEQSVVDKVVADRIAEQEQDGKKLSNREKSKIRDAVITEMDKGYLSTDTIEEVLGGETYKTYKDTIDSEDSLLSEYEELGNLKESDMTAKQKKRFNELDQQIAEMQKTDTRSQLKTKLSEEVSGMVQGSRLSESYAERARRGQAFEADLTKYDTKQQETVKRAIDSGVLNNTRRTHELVDMIAKISADKGVLFDFTNNAKLKESGFAVDGKTVNGFIKDGNITINTQSSKYINSVVGHEITHVLEGTELYSELQTAVFQYAQTKGDYQGRLDTLTKLYKDIEGADVNAELTADLVGDYLFMDSDFVNTLSTQHRNVFQKVYDEIKYLYKVATAGSKEARQLEQVKRAFDKAYKASNKANADTKYSLAMVEDVQPHSDLWHRTLTTEEAKARFPKLWDVTADESEVRNPTQISSTVKSYRKVYDTLKAEGFNGTILDASSGLGYGTKAGIEEYGFNVEDIEPYPDKGYNPKYKDYSTLNKKYDAIISNAVLNVLPQDQRDALVVKMGEMLNDGGRIFINVRGKDVDSLASNKNNTQISPMEWFVDSTGSYQKGFTKPELVAYLQDALGDGFTVEPTNMFGAVSAIVTKGSGVKYSLSAEQQEYFKDSVVRDENGNLKPMYHGTSRGGHTVFDTYGSNYGLFGQGSYFTDSKSVAESYTQKGKGNNPQVYETYLNITNPMDMDAQADPAAWQKAFPDAMFPNSGTNEDFYRAMEEYFEDEQYPKWEAAEAAMDAIEGMGYDGITHIGGGRVDPNGERHQVYIAFHQEQIKNIDNVKPTSNPDIRFSLSNEVTDAQNEHGLDAKSEVHFSLSNDTAYMDKAISKNESMLYVGRDVMNTAKAIRERIAARMNDIKDRGLVGLPEDIEGNTYIANSSYDGTEENTTICPRSLASEAFVDAVSEYLGRPLTVEEQIYISQDLQGRSLTPECTYCYVATDRKAYRAFLGEYVSQRDAVIQKVQENPDADVSRNGELYKEFLNGRKDTNPMYSRFKMWVDAYKNGKPMIDASHLANINKLMGDINSEFGAELKPQIVDAMKYAQSASWAKKRINYVAYNGHILNWKQDRINKLNSHYGLRMYSFSDFHPAFVLENMQMITDASVRGLKMLGYTKDTDFVEIFAPSGMNINVSTFGFESGGNVYENNIIGAEWEKAKALREQYPNVGVTFVATNDTLVEWALAQDWIDVVIPYHLVRTGAEVAKAFNYTNYTSESSDTKKAEWAKGDAKYIAPTDHNNDKATYLAALEKNHLNPRFERFIDNPNYMKLVNECRQPASESKPVQPVFNEDAAMKALAKLEANGYYQPIGGSVDRMYEIAAEVAENMTQELAPSMSLSNVGDTPKRYGNYAVSGKDISLEVAPVQEDILPDDYAPMAEDEADFQDRFASLDDADAPPEVEAPYYSNTKSTLPADPFADRDMVEVGNRKVKAYMYENPEVKPFFQEAARVMLGDLGNTIRGERFYSEEAFNKYGNERAWTGVSRTTTDDIADLLDNWHYSYDQIEKGLKDIIEDNGKENNAVSKRIEFMLDDRLRNGYKDVWGEPMPPDQNYIDLLNEKQITEYGEEAFKSYLEALGDDLPPEAMAIDDDVAPVANVNTAPSATSESDIAPMQEFEAIRPQPKKTVYGDKLVRVDGGNGNGGVANSHTAEVLVDEPKAAKKKSNLWSMIKENVLDNGMVFEDLAKKRKNRELEAKWNYIRYSEGRAQQLIGNGTDGVKSLNAIQEQVSNAGKTKQFYEYLYHLHNVDRMTLEERYEDTRNKAVFGDNVTAEVSRKAAAQLETANPEFKRWSREVYTYNNHLRQLLVDGGVISQETADLWAEMYPHYVPIRRAGDFGLDINVPLDTGKTGVNAPVKRATGGSSDILPLFDTMAQRTMQTYKAIAKNRFGVELKNTLGTTIAKDTATVDGVIDSIDTQDGLLQEGKNGKNPTFTVFENGERVTFEITEEMYNALKPKSEAMAYTNPVLNTASNIHRGVLTEYNPVFMLTNAIKDAQDVLINSQHPAKTYAKFPEAISQMVKNGKWYTEYMDNGGEQNTYFDNETSTFSAEETGAKKLLGVPPLSWISKANNVTERLPRLAEYIASRESGRSVETAMLDSARVTTNFAAGGKLTKFLNRNGATFLNASVQGAVQQARNVREAKMNGLKGWVSLAAKFAIAGLPAALLNGLLWDDDEEYEELSDYVKQNYYVVAKYGDGKFVRIPKGRTVAVIQSAFEQIGNALTGNDEVDLKTFLELAISNLAPNNPIDNNIIAPIIQVANNETWYGEDLVPTRLQDLPAAEQFDESTDAISKWLGEKLNYSPVKINYLLDQYSGGIGDTILPMFTPEAESGDNSIVGNILAPLKSKFTTDSVMNNQNVSDFYDKMDELATNAKASAATDKDVLSYKYFSSVNADLGELYQKKREIQNGDLPDAEKYAQVREIQRQIVDLTKNGLNSYGSVSVSGDYATVGDRYFKRNEEGEWSKLSEEQVAKYKATSAAGDAPYATDGDSHWRWYQKDGETEGEWRKVTDKELEKQEAVISGLGISPEEYWRNKDEYVFAYENPEKYSVAKSVGGYDAYKTYNSELYDIKADKDTNGKSISGSRKEKVLDYINGLDADYGEKIILFKSEYPADDTYNYEIVDYLNSRDDISYSEMVTILTELGFTVDSDGNVIW